MEGGSSRYDYEGKEFDSTTGQYDFHFRGYKAEWGKFMQPDSLLPNIYDPQQLNRYAFERGNPWKNVDPDGHVQLLVLAAILVLFFIIEDSLFIPLIGEIGKFVYEISIYNEDDANPQANEQINEGVNHPPVIEDVNLQTEKETPSTIDVEDKKIGEELNPNAPDPDSPDEKEETDKQSTTYYGGGRGHRKSGNRMTDEELLEEARKNKWFPNWSGWRSSGDEETENNEEESGDE